LEGFGERVGVVDEGVKGLRKKRGMGQGDRWNERVEGLTKMSSLDI
jgi:hypothetical protein